MTDRADVAITAAKGRPMLVWVGKRPLRRVTAFPAQHVETFDPTGSLGAAPPDARWADWPDRYPRGGLLFHGDNKEVLAHLLANGFRGKVKLVYIDPPFDSGADYVRQVQLRGAKGSAKLGGEGYALGEQIQYTDIWTNDNYLQFMYERLLLLRELLTADGSFYLHCDWNRSYLLRCLLDEVFGTANCRNEIIWQRNYARSDSHTYNHIHDTLYFYTKGESFEWNKQYTEYDREYIDRFYRFIEEETGRQYASDNLTAAGLRRGSSGRPWRGFDPSRDGNHWKYTTEKLDELDAEGRIHWPESGGMPRYKRYLDEMKGRPLQSIWTDISFLSSWSGEREDYQTQKPEALLERIIRASSCPGDIVLDCFIGSGTTAAVAQKLGRRWIGCDINKGAIQTTSRRLQTIIAEQAAERADPVQGALLAGGDEGDEDTPPPAQLAFTVWRVNDYDLQIQHNEAVALACEHLGVACTRADAYFDGLLGNRLVKIVPFTHPLTLLDLEELKRELAARPDEPRDVVLVCLGKESAADAWLDHWNRLRTQNGIPNRIDVVELRTDPKVGGFFSHQPATARVDVRREDDRLVVEVLDFISPTIVQRLKDQAGILAPHIDDWRSMVDTIMIDTAYDGQVFDIVLSDVPEKKDDLVAGRYDLPAPDGETTVAVKLIDMLGEEVLVTRQV